MEEKKEDLRQERAQDFQFMQEKIKERPLNRKKLLRRSVITASMAVIFGLIACLTFLLLEPILSNWLYPKEEPSVIEFPEAEEETQPEDLIVEAEEETPVPSTIVKKVDMEISDFQQLYRKMYALTQDVSKSLVTVTGVVSDVDWFNNTFEDKGQNTGLLVAENGKEYLVLVDRDVVEGAEAIQVTFYDGRQASATVKEEDINTGLVVIAVAMTDLGENAKGAYPVADLGNSNSTYLLGVPVIAVGNPLGTGRSVSYGIITSTGRTVNMVDYNYKMFTTDMYGSPTASGAIVSLSGQVLGIIHQDHNNADIKNLISALGISELKDTIERMSNGRANAYMGIYGTDVTTDVNIRLGVPLGAYVTSVEMDSPAMRSGIRSGDVIVRIGEQEILSYKAYEELLDTLTPGYTAEVTVMRQGPEDYQEMILEVTLGEG